VLQAVLQMPVEVQSELCRQNLVPSFPQSRRSIVAEHPLILLEQLLMNEKVCALILLVTLPYLTFRVGRLLHLPSAEAVSVRPNAQPRCNQKVTVIGCEAKTLAVKPKSAVKPNKSPATWNW